MNPDPRMVEVRKNVLKQNDVIARALRGRRFYSLYQVPWQDMDLADPQHPRLSTAKRDLRHAK